MTPRRGSRFLALAVLLLAVVGPNTGSEAYGAPPAGSRRPNIVFLLTDDLDTSELAFMPNLQSLIIDQGVSFERDYVSVSLCCPSRSTILRGQYSHNTGVETNGGTNGGFATAHRLGIERSTIGTWMHDAGYRTAYIGKYLNGYPDTVASTFVPPGWDEWDSASAGVPYSEYSYTLNENGHLHDYGVTQADYGTTVYMAKAQHFIGTTANGSQPFFVYLNVYAPHEPATPALADRARFPDAQAPRTPSFNDPSEPTKPAWVRRLPVMDPRTIAAVDGLYRRRIQSLQAVDRGIASLIDTLRRSGQLDNTYFFVSSDNGYHLGQFRLPAGKETAYESDIRVPLAVRGPGIPPGGKVEALVGNVDLAPTFAQLGGASVPRFVDGSSFASLLHDPTPRGPWRQSFLVEHWTEGLLAPRPQKSGPLEPSDLDETTSVATPTGVVTEPIETEAIPEFHAVRTDRTLYVEYRTGERELYDTAVDPYELQNLAGLPTEASLVRRFHRLLRELMHCRRSACRRIEDRPAPA